MRGSHKQKRQIATSVGRWGTVVCLCASVWFCGRVSMIRGGGGGKEGEEFVLPLLTEIKKRECLPCWNGTSATGVASCVCVFFSKKFTLTYDVLLSYPVRPNICFVPLCGLSRWEGKLAAPTVRCILPFQQIALY